MSGVTHKRGRELALRYQKEATKNTSHELEWIDMRNALCLDCGIGLHLIPTRHPRQGTKGWKTIAVWGGNDYGVGGVYEEPICRGPAGGRR